MSGATASVERRPPADGLLELHFEEVGGATVLARGRGVAPLRVHRPFPLADGRALIQMVTLGPGLCGGDRARVRVTVAEGARAVVVDAAAAKVLSSRGAPAQLDLEVSVAEGGELELYPGRLIPFPDAELEVRTRVALAEGARFALLERWSCGRLERGERERFRRLTSDVRLNVAGRLRYADRTRLEPGGLGTGVLDGNDRLASGVWVWDGSGPEPLEGELAASGSTDDGIHLLRALGRSATDPPLFATLDRWRAGQDLAAIAWERYGS